MKKSVIKKGFTLIEILVVIGMIAILATIVIIAINPSRQFKQGRDTQRLSNVNAILNAIGQRAADNTGNFSGLVGGTTQSCPAIATGTTLSIYNGSVGSASGAIDLSCLTPTYLPSFPSDPSVTPGNDTGYTINVDSNGRTTVAAPSAEINKPISVTR